MYTAMLTVENIARGAHHDVWSVNVEEEYHEESPATTTSTPVGHARHRPRRAGDSRAHYAADHPVNKPSSTP